MAGRLRILMIPDVYFPRVNGASTSIQTFRGGLMALGHRVLRVAPGYPGSATRATCWRGRDWVLRWRRSAWC